jgi:hypothetical protein
MISRQGHGGRHLPQNLSLGLWVPAFAGTTRMDSDSNLERSVGWAKARQRRAHHVMLGWRWWARFALPTLRTRNDGGQAGFRLQTSQGYDSAFSRHDAPEVCISSPSPRTEGAGKTGCALHPRSRVQDAQKNAHTSIQVQRRQSGLPCAMVLRLTSCSPR